MDLLQQLKAFWFKQASSVEITMLTFTSTLIDVIIV